MAVCEALQSAVAAHPVMANCAVVGKLDKGAMRANIAPFEKSAQKPLVNCAAVSCKRSSPAAQQAEVSFWLLFSKK
jgi:hypothetical protein